MLFWNAAFDRLSQSEMIVTWLLLEEVDLVRQQLWIGCFIEHACLEYLGEEKGIYQLQHEKRHLLVDRGEKALRITQMKSLCAG